jgi:hypothetical protein
MERLTRTDLAHVRAVCLEKVVVFVGFSCTLPADTPFRVRVLLNQLPEHGPTSFRQKKHGRLQQEAERRGRASLPHAAAGREREEGLLTAAASRRRARCDLGETDCLLAASGFRLGGVARPGSRGGLSRVEGNYYWWRAWLIQPRDGSRDDPTCDPFTEYNLLSSVTEHLFL